MRNYFRLSILLIFVYISPNAFLFAQTPNGSLSIDSLANQLEKRGINIYYQADWFKGKSFHPSIVNSPIDEIASVLENSCNCSQITIDSTTIVFVPKNISTNSLSSNEGLILVGDPRRYGKYAKAVVDGKIINGKTGEPLIGAKIFIDKVNIGATADKSGEFSITLPVGEHNVRLISMGYEENQLKMKVFSSGSATFKIVENSVKLQEVVVTSKRNDNNVTNTQMSVVKLNRKDIKELPLIFGETDIIKSASLLPGVQTVGEFGTGFNVRGGGADQNLILIEDVPIFNSSHLFGLTSIVNPDGISDVTLLKAGIPAKYGERASSLMDIRMGMPTSEEIRVKGGIGLINSRLTVDVPLFKNKVNLLVGGRTTYSDWLLRKMPDIDLKNSSAKFYDLNVLLTVSPNLKNKFTAFAYYSKDNFRFSQNTTYAYDNMLASIRWKHILNSKLTSDLMTGISRYAYEISELDTLRRTEASRLNSEILYNNIKWNLSWHPNNSHAVDVGTNAVFYAVKPGNLAPYDSKSLVLPLVMKKENANEIAFYASDNFTLTPKIGIEMGLRISTYTLKGPRVLYTYKEGSSITSGNVADSVVYGNGDVVKRYAGLEPRISFRYSINDYSSVKLSYNRTNQYINLVSNTAVMAPTDNWKLSDPYVKPLKCDQVAAGYFRNFSQNAIETSVELYYKDYKDIVEYKNGAQLLLNNHLETELLNAKGYNYGIELFVKKNTGRLTGWASYTYSRSKRKTDGLSMEDQINGNHYFPSTFDKPHNIVLNANYHITRRWRFSSSFQYSTGRPVTFPEYKYNLQGNQLIYYSERNKYRLPDYHRLDVSITLDESLRVKTKWKGSWTLSIINLYGRKNVYSAYYKKSTPSESNDFRTYSLYKLYIIGMPLPTITYNFSF